MLCACTAPSFPLVALFGAAMCGISFAKRQQQHHHTILPQLSSTLLIDKLLSACGRIAQGGLCCVPVQAGICAPALSGLFILLRNLQVVLWCETGSLQWLQSNKDQCLRTKQRCLAAC